MLAMNTRKKPLHPDAAILDAIGGPSHVAEQLGLPREGGRQRVHGWRVNGVPADVKLQFPHIFLRDFKVDKRQRVKVQKPGKRQTPIVFDDISVVRRRARKGDPETSKAAAVKSTEFSATHAGRVMTCLYSGPKGADAISRETGLTVVQVCRRLPDLQARQLAEPTGDQVNGFRVWRAIPR